MASIQAGTQSIRDILAAANFDFEKEAAADYNNGAPDSRRVKVGGLGFDELDKQIEVPVTADEVEITLDGKKVAALTVELSDEQKEERRYSFDTAADASEPAKSSK